MMQRYTIAERVQIIHTFYENYRNITNAHVSNAM